MLTLKRLGVYLLTFVVLVCIVVILLDWKWLNIDNLLVNRINNHDNVLALNKEIVFVNLKHPDTKAEMKDFILYRQSIIKLLNTIAAESKKETGPKASSWLLILLTSKLSILSHFLSSKLKTIHTKTTKVIR